MKSSSSRSVSTRLTSPIVPEYVSLRFQSPWIFSTYSARSSVGATQPICDSDMQIFRPGKRPRLPLKIQSSVVEIGRIKLLEASDTRYGASSDVLDMFDDDPECMHNGTPASF